MSRVECHIQMGVVWLMIGLCDYAMTLGGEVKLMKSILTYFHLFSSPIVNNEITYAHLSHFTLDSSTGTHCSLQMEDMSQ